MLGLKLLRHICMKIYCCSYIYIYIYKKIMESNPTICEEKLSTSNPNRN